MHRYLIHIYEGYPCIYTHILGHHNIILRVGPAYGGVTSALAYASLYNVPCIYRRLHLHIQPYIMPKYTHRHGNWGAEGAIAPPPPNIQILCLHIPQSIVAL